MGETLRICSVCAWRATCQKKFSVSGHDVNCTDFTEDMTLSRASQQDTDDTQGEK